MNTIVVFALLWGVWLITPILVDGLDALVRLFLVRTHRKGRERVIATDELPMLTLVVPAHNEEAVIDRCLRSIKAQDYPHDRLEVIIIDDGSTDGTADIIESHVANETEDKPLLIAGRKIMVGPFEGEIRLIRNGHAGKAHALNTGIRASRGDIIVNIDSDVVLAPDAMRSVAEAFIRDPKMGAATGNIEIDWDLCELRDDAGEIVFDDEGLPVPRKLTRGERLMARCQFLEYMSSFRLGRQAQAITGSMYTLAGACSAFRRDVLEGGALYSNATVSEDTHLTLDLHRSDTRIGFMDRVRVFVEPTVDWDALYAQRVRWTRGQLEVCAIHRDFIGAKAAGRFGRFALPQMLLFDHTLAFPRLIWVPILLFFPLLGYAWSTILIALIGMYVLYVVVEALNTHTCYRLVDDDSKKRIENSGWALLMLPLFRFIVFHFRFSGFLVTLMEEQRWTMPGPMQETRQRVDFMRVRSIRFVGAVLSVVRLAFLPALRALQFVLVPAIAGILYTVLETLSSNRRVG